MHRLERINSLLKEELARIMTFKTGDPRFQKVTVLGVSVAKDLSFAKVYISIDCGGESVDSTLKALNGASGYFRALLAENLNLRRTPKLAFYVDDSIGKSVRVAEILRKVLPDKERRE